MKRFLIFSLVLHFLFLGAFAFGLHRLGGWKYAWHRLRHNEAGPYAHRKDLFAQLPARTGAVVFFGDSQIEQCEWEELLGDSLPALNRGIVGDGVGGLLTRLDTDVLRHRPAGVVVCVGANDLLFGRSPADIAADYRTLAQKIRRDAPQARLALVSVLPVNNTLRRSGLDNAAVRAVNDKIRQIAGETDAAYLDVHARLTDIGGNLATHFTDDGVHLNGAGYFVWKQELEPFLK